MGRQFMRVPTSQPTDTMEYSIGRYLLPPQPELVTSSRPPPPMIPQRSKLRPTSDPSSSMAEYLSPRHHSRSRSHLDAENYYLFADTFGGGLRAVSAPHNVFAFHQDEDVTLAASPKSPLKRRPHIRRPRATSQPPPSLRNPHSEDLGHPSWELQRPSSSLATLYPTNSGLSPTRTPRPSLHPIITSNLPTQPRSLSRSAAGHQAQESEVQKRTLLPPPTINQIVPKSMHTNTASRKEAPLQCSSSRSSFVSIRPLPAPGKQIQPVLPLPPLPSIPTPVPAPIPKRSTARPLPQPKDAILAEHAASSSAGKTPTRSSTVITTGSTAETVASSPTTVWSQPSIPPSRALSVSVAFRMNVTSANETDDPLADWPAAVDAILNAAEARRNNPQLSIGDDDDDNLHTPHGTDASFSMQEDASLLRRKDTAEVSRMLIERWNRASGAVAVS